MNRLRATSESDESTRRAFFSARSSSRRARRKALRAAFSSGERTSSVGFGSIPVHQPIPVTLIGVELGVWVYLALELHPVDLPGGIDGGLKLLEKARRADVERLGNDLEPH